MTTRPEFSDLCRPRNLSFADRVSLWLSQGCNDFSRELDAIEQIRADYRQVLISDRKLEASGMSQGRPVNYAIRRHHSSALDVEVRELFGRGFVDQRSPKAILRDAERLLRDAVAKSA